MSKYRVSHFPQVPCKPFEVEVTTLGEALRLENTLAMYDLFQLENRIKPDFANMTYIEVWNEEESEWEEVDPYEHESILEAEAAA